MAEARIDPTSITVLALTHTHQDHVQGLLTPDGRVLFPNLKAIAIAEAAVESFLAEIHLARFRPLLKPVRNGDQVAERLRAVALPGHAPGHTGYAFDTNEDRFLLGTSFMCRPCSSAIPHSVGAMTTINRPHALPA
jgi:glyoxylase-like metal-dependent hydrolase (beta-lactamase superfamily II)